INPTLSFCCAYPIGMNASSTAITTANVSQRLTCPFIAACTSGLLSYLLGFAGYSSLRSLTSPCGNSHRTLSLRGPKARSNPRFARDCFVATLLAMTEVGDIPLPFAAEVGQPQCRRRLPGAGAPTRCYRQDQDREGEGHHLQGLRWDPRLEAEREMEQRAKQQRRADGPQRIPTGEDRQGDDDPSDTTRHTLGPRRPVRYRQESSRHTRQHAAEYNGEIAHECDVDAHGVRCCRRLSDGAQNDAPPRVIQKRPQRHGQQHTQRRQDREFRQRVAEREAFPTSSE